MNGRTVLTKPAQIWTRFHKKLQRLAKNDGLFLHAVMAETTIKFMYWTVRKKKKNSRHQNTAPRLFPVWYNMQKIAWMD